MDIKSLLKTVFGSNLISVLTSLASVLLAPLLFALVAGMGLSPDMTINQAVAAAVTGLVALIARMIGEEPAK